MEHWVRTVLDELVEHAPGPVPARLATDIKRIVNVIEAAPGHTFRKPAVEAVAHQIDECETIEALGKLMWEATIECGFQNFVVFVLSQGKNAAFRSRVCTSHQSKWIERYQEKSYQFIDPAVAAARTSDGPIIFSELPDDAPMLRDFWDDADAHGVGRNGIAFVTTFEEGCRIGVSFNTSNTASKTTELLRRNGYDMEALAKLAANRFHDLSISLEAGDCPLTERELRFLHVLATSSNPVEALELNSGFGSNRSLQAAIRDKLNVTTVFQAIAHAVSRGWFDDLPYSPEEVHRPYPPLRSIDTDLFQLADFEVDSGSATA